MSGAQVLPLRTASFPKAPDMKFIVLTLVKPSIRWSSREGLVCLTATEIMTSLYILFIFWPLVALLMMKTGLICYIIF